MDCFERFVKGESIDIKVELSLKDVFRPLLDALMRQGSFFMKVEYTSGNIEEVFHINEEITYEGDKLKVFREMYKGIETWERYEATVEEYLAKIKLPDTITQAFVIVDSEQFFGNITFDAGLKPVETKMVPVNDHSYLTLSTLVSTTSISCFADDPL